MYIKKRIIIMYRNTQPSQMSRKDNNFKLISTEIKS